MELPPSDTFFTLEDRDSGFLDDFAKAGWQLIETRKTRDGGPDEWTKESIDFILGAKTGAKHPETYVTYCAERDRRQREFEKSMRL